MADELKDQRIPIMMSPSEVKAIDDWMFANRIKSRAQAIRRLCQMGLGLDTNIGRLTEATDEIFHAHQKMDELPVRDENGKLSLEKHLDVLGEVIFGSHKGWIKLRDPVHELNAAANIYRTFYPNDGSDNVATFNYMRELLLDVIREAKEKKAGTKKESPKDKPDVE